MGFWMGMANPQLSLVSVILTQKILGQMIKNWPRYAHLKIQHHNIISGLTQPQSFQKIHNVQGFVSKVLWVFVGFWKDWGRVRPDIMLWCWNLKWAYLGQFLTIWPKKNCFRITETRATCQLAYTRRKPMGDPCYALTESGMICSGDKNGPKWRI